MNETPTNKRVLFTLIFECSEEEAERAGVHLCCMRKALANLHREALISMHQRGLTPEKWEVLKEQFEAGALPPC